MMKHCPIIHTLSLLLRLFPLLRIQQSLFCRLLAVCDGHEPVELGGGLSRDKTTIVQRKDKNTDQLGK